MLKHIVTLCDELGIRLYAAGLDSEQEYANITQLGVSVGQGNYVTDGVRSQNRSDKRSTA